MGAGLLALVACQTVYDGDLGLVACAGEGAFGPPACPAGRTCVAGACVGVGVPLGATCAGDADCRAGTFCLDPAEVGGTGAARCTASCCASGDCGEAALGQVCWIPPEGPGSYCWPASAVEGRAAPGLANQGEACSAPGECRSGVCADGRCAGACCDGSYCRRADEVCRVRLTDLSSHDAWSCGAPPTSAMSHECNSGNDCASGKCLPVDPSVSVCAQPCCSSSDCGSVWIKGVPVPLACAPALDGHIRACSKLLSPAATRGVGEACSAHDQCRGGLCVDDGAGSYCSDLCCRDSDCGDISAFACLVRPSGTTSALRCVRK